MNETLESRLRMLDGSGLIRQAARDPEPEYAFRHVLSLEAAYESMLRQDRRRLHLVVGECLERTLAGSLEEYAPILARHFDEAGDDARALDYLTRAANSASRRYANREAIMLLDRARAVALRGLAGGAVISDLCVRAGRLREMSGDYDAALRTYDELEVLAAERSDMRMAAQSILARAAIFCAPTTRFDAARGLATAQEALRRAIAAGDGAAESKAHWLIMLVSKFNQDPERALQSGEASAAIARELGLREQLAYTMNDIYAVYIAAGSAGKAIAALEEAERLWRELGNLPLLADTLASLGEMRAFRDGIAAAEPILLEAVRITDSTGNLWGQSYSRAVLALTRLEAARYGEVIALSERSADLGRQAGFAISQIMTPCISALCCADLGQPERGIQLARTAFTIAETLVPSWRGYPAAMLSLCIIAAGDRDAAAEAMERARALATPYDTSTLYESLAEVEYARLLGAHEDVIRLAGETETMFKAFNCRLYTPVLWARKAAAEAALGRLVHAEASAREALARMTALGTRRWAWQVHSALCDVLKSLGRHEEAAVALARARADISFVEAHAGAEDLRKSFLAIPAVARLQEER